MLKIATDERVCLGCNAATLTCQVMRLDGSDWNEALELRASSGTGETARLSAHT